MRGRSKAIHKIHKEKINRNSRKKNKTKKNSHFRLGNVIQSGGGWKISTNKQGEHVHIFTLASINEFGIVVHALSEHHWGAEIQLCALAFKHTTQCNFSRISESLRNQGKCSTVAGESEKQNVMHCVVAVVNAWKILDLLKHEVSIIDEGALAEPNYEASEAACRLQRKTSTAKHHSTGCTEILSVFRIGSVTLVLNLFS